MNENINLTEILKDCPKGWKFWSPIFGEVEFTLNAKELGYVNVAIKNGDIWSFNSDATITIGNIKSVEIMLYPSRDICDWSKFTAPWYKKERFDHNSLNSFDRVLCKNGPDIWRCDFFSSYKEAYTCPNICVGGCYIYCIPYNNDTKHLAGTKDEAPEFYRYWED